jgi:endo-1,4-beta-mannosidase
MSEEHEITAYERAVQLHKTGYQISVLKDFKKNPTYTGWQTGNHDPIKDTDMTFNIL